MAYIHSLDKGIPVIVISNPEDAPVAVGFLEKGASACVMKHGHAKELLWNAVSRISENPQLKREAADLRDRLAQKPGIEKAFSDLARRLKLVLFPFKKLIEPTAVLQ